MFNIDSSDITTLNSPPLNFVCSANVLACKRLTNYGHVNFEIFMQDQCQLCGQKNVNRKDYSERQRSFLFKIKK